MSKTIFPLIKRNVGEVTYEHSYVQALPRNVIIAAAERNLYVDEHHEINLCAYWNSRIAGTYLRTGEISDWKPYLTAIAQHLIDDFGYKKIDATENKKPFIFIIDEINRGEMSKIFGELFFAIEPGYRGAEKCRDLRTQYANLQTIPNLFDVALGVKDSENFGHFFIPENVYIIGTMNDIDRNVESMDFAFRRRFTFKEITAKDTQEQILSGLDDSIREDAIRRMDSLNDAISKIEGLSSAYHIGGAYFLKLNELGNDFDLLWEYHLEGLLREYLRGMEDADSKLAELKAAYENKAVGEQKEIDR